MMYRVIQAAYKDTERVLLRIDEPVTDDEDSRPYLDTEFMDGYNVRSVLIELNIGQWKERERLGIR
jgi:hypothetical protein